MNLFQLFLASSMPVLKVIIVTLVGSVISLDRINIFPQDARKHFNHVVFYVFNPALIFANLAKTLTIRSLVSMWYMPLNILITFIMGSILGWVIIHFTKAPPHLRGLILGCCSGGNLGFLPLIIVPAICKEKSSPFGDPDMCIKYGMAYVSLSLAIGAIYMWSYVYNIVRISSSMNPKVNEVNGSINGVSNGTINTHHESNIEAPPLKDSTISQDNADRLAQPCSRPDETTEASSSVGILQRLKILARKMNLRRLIAPSTIGAILGFIVGVVPPFRWLFIGQTAPLHVIQDATALLGEGAIPTISLIMGGNLIKGLRGSGVNMSIIGGIVAVRYILLPLFGVFVVKGAIHFGMVHSDPLFKFVLLLQYALPPAMAISTMSQLFGAGENECSIIMIWAYSLASVSLTLWSILFMWLVT